MTTDSAQSPVPPTCILTGADGENPDDCTTHDHEGDEIDVEVTFKLVVSVHPGYTQEDVSDAVNGYIHDTGSLPEPVSVVEL